MKKLLNSFLYLVSHPTHSVQISRLYRHLHGRYKFTIMLAHSYRESHYLKLSPYNISPNYSSGGRSLNAIGRPLIVTLHDGLTHSGGLTDRLKGMCTLYSFAKDNGYAFKIYFTSPFNLEKYLIPNTYDWTIDASSLCYDLASTAVYIWEDMRSARAFFQLNNTKSQLHIGCNSAESYPYYSELFHELFRPSELLESELKYHLNKLGGQQKFIAISFRFQNLLGEFKEGNSKALVEKKRELLINACLKEIAKIYAKYKIKILVTSDSNIFRDIVLETFAYVYTYTIPEEVGHIDYAEAGKSKELTAFVDMFLISCARKAYQVRNTEMYNSDFPRMAAKINNVPYEVIGIL